ncbi:MAG: hypothetical protein ACOCQ1_03805 [Halanaerobiaceae bacterium]
MFKKGFIITFIVIMVLITIFLPEVTFSEEDSSDKFAVNIDIIEPLSIDVSDDLSFGRVETGSADQETSVEASVAGEPGYSYSVSFSDGGEVNLENDNTSDSIPVLLDSSIGDTSELDSDGGDGFEITAFIAEEELEDITPETYSGQGMITVEYKH